MKKTKLSIDYSFVKKGISLIVLVISIIIMIILAGVTMFILSETGVLEKAREASFKNSMKAYMESVSVYISDKLLQEKTVSLDEINVAQVVNGENIELKKIIPNVKKDHIKYLSIEKGVLIFNIVDTNSAEDIKYGYWACQAGITVKDFEECSDVYNIDKKPYYTGQYINGVCTPDLTGFNIAKTRYVYYESNGVQIIGDTIDKAPPANWFKYNDNDPANNKWANIVVENSGNLAYFIWIPRYEYNYNTTTKITNINFISKEDTAPTMGYAIPEGFSWNIDEEENTLVNLSGIWFAKYKVSENNNANTDFTYIANSKEGKIDVTVNTTATGTLKYYYYISEQGQTLVKKADSSTATYTFNSLKNGTMYDILVQVYTLDASGNITSLAGECFKTVAMQTPETPDLTGFSPLNTKYISYDDKGEELIGNNTTGAAPNNWYNYLSNSWANILVVNNYNAAYFTWIPKYEYRTYYYNGALRTDINFVSATKTTPTSSFKIPEGFSWDMTDSEGTIVNLKGIWMSKYKISENNYFNANFTYKAYSTYIDVTETITTYTKTGTLYYDFYISKQKEQLVKKDRNTTGIYTFSGLNSGTTYDILVKIIDIDSSGNTISNVGVVEKSIYLYEPSDPIMTGFNPQVTKYVRWLEDDTEFIGNNISEAAPNDWYNYKTNNWANIVTIKDQNNMAYFTWVPRYEYRTYYYNNILNTDINFIPATKTTPTKGFEIPEGFTWDMTDSGKSAVNLAGIWMSKYKVSANE